MADDRFELLERIGRGGMGTVWKARSRATGEVVALKVLHEQYSDDTQYLARFEREVHVGRSINSPYVVRVLGYGRQDSRPYIAMEFVDGQSLRELVKAKGRLSWDEAEPIVAQVWAGLVAAHAVNVIHRDVKPSNILVGKDGVAKLADFGIARSLEATRLTGSSTMLGTPYYMAPDGDASHASDLYAMGCVLYEMLAGVPPFEGDSPQKVLLRHLREEPDLERIPVPARPLVEALLTKEPEARVERALPLLDGLDLPPPPWPRPLPVAPPPRRRGWPRWPVALAGGGFLAVIVGMVVLTVMTSGGGKRPTLAEAVSGNTQTMSPATPTATSTAIATVTQAGRYVVRAGDTCGAIAANNNVTLVQLSAANGWADFERECQRLSVGQAIVIPTATPTFPPAPSSTPTPPSPAAAPPVSTVAPTRTAATPATTVVATPTGVIRHLWSRNAAGLLEADLAAGWEWRDPQTLIIRVRSVVLADGTTLTADRLRNTLTTVSIPGVVAMSVESPIDLRLDLEKGLLANQRSANALMDAIASVPLASK